MNLKSYKQYASLLEINEQINLLLVELISSNAHKAHEYDVFNNKLGQLLSNKDEIIESFELLKSDSQTESKNSTDSFDEAFEEELQKLKEIIERIQVLEKENLNLMAQKKEIIAAQINKVNQTVKTLGAYKFNKEDKPRIIDESE